MTKHIGLNDMPYGKNIMLAIMPMTGFNQEDSILFNEASIERGLFHATIYHTEKDEDKKLNGEEIPSSEHNPIFHRNVKYTDKVYRNFIKEMNKTIKLQQRLSQK